MNGWKRFLALWTTAALLVAVCPPVVCGEAAGELEAANPDEEYKALSMWLSETEGTVNLYTKTPRLRKEKEKMLAFSSPLCYSIVCGSKTAPWGINTVGRTNFPFVTPTELPEFLVRGSSPDPQT